MPETIRLTALATFILLGCILPASAEFLTGEQIRTFSVGTPFEVRRLGMRAQLLYAPDGTFRTDSARMSGSGTWEITGDTICATMVPRPRQGEQCFTLEAFENAALRTSEGVVLKPVH
ncbi:hypothetical protein [Roseobacter sinensis]|uniref:Secreted protein n=1 Tax=Roseobacter sinensis TaxID=2931391 RepID=A0ABT3BKY2_9RHOB|nr:hypothetical protein [Roseobacter sp. WL0113]MCV3274227.1 hypothetical protein [Roseobacter sp. WL0113]